VLHRERETAASIAVLAFLYLIGAADSGSASSLRLSTARVSPIRTGVLSEPQHRWMQVEAMFPDLQSASSFG
jgi:hypothetical protein